LSASTSTRKQRYRKETAVAHPDNRPEATVEEYRAPAGGRGAVKSSVVTFHRQGIAGKVVVSFAKANKPGGFDCPGCAFPDKGGAGFGPDSCEQGQKAIAWEMTRKQVGADFFEKHSLATLRSWTDFDLENHGRLSEPLLFDVDSGHYRAVGWDVALGVASAAMRALDPNAVSFYASGRSSNEAAFLWQLMARSYGSANLPDSSNLCHEPSGYAMKAQIGMGKGTCSLDDFERAELIMVIGQNPATNHPRMAGALHEASKRGAKIVAINPLTERGFVNFSDPKDIAEMVLGRGRKVAQKVYNVRIGGDLALIKGIMKRLVEMEDAGAPIIDWEFVGGHTRCFNELADNLRDESWEVICAKSGIAKTEIFELADLYAASKATMITWCMGITHHEDSVATVETIVDLLLMRGNIGKPGAGAVPVRGHSNVQGDRTMGATFKVPERYLDNIQARFGGLELNRSVGKDAIATIEGLIDGSVEGFLSLGGNFGAASPDAPRIFKALSRSALTIHIATKFNRTHCYPGAVGLVLPCLGRTDRDVRSGEEQFVTVEDSMSMVHSSRGIQNPSSPEMMSEPAICAELGHRVVGSDKVDWLAMSNDYDLIRDHIEACQAGVFDGFERFNERIAQPGGFWLPNWAAKRVWRTASGKAEFRVNPVRLDGPIERATARDGDAVLALMTIRSHDQFNTTIYGLDDRYRGIFGGRHVLFANITDITRLGFADGDYVDIRTCSEDNIERVVYGFRLVKFDIPQGCVAAYFPEATPLAPSGLVSRGSRTPASKEIPVLLSPARVTRAGGGVPELAEAET
jgi:molybdopterin-dependent oxidoreductase alpha subunit